MKNSTMMVRSVELLIPILKSINIIQTINKIGKAGYSADDEKFFDKFSIHSLLKH